MKEGRLNHTLELVTMNETRSPDCEGHAIESAILALGDAAYRELVNAAWCGTPGFSGYNDRWGVKLSCPGYGLN